MDRGILMGIGSVSLAAIVMSMTVVPAFAAPGYTEVRAAKVTQSKSGANYNYRMITSGNIPDAPDEYISSIDAFAYAWVAGVDCSQYELSDCGGNHATGVFAMIDQANPDWQVVSGTFSIHPLDICNGNQAIFGIENHQEAKIELKGHSVRISIDSNDVPVTPGNFTGGGPMALFVSPYESDVLCVGVLDN